MIRLEDLWARRSKPEGLKEALVTWAKRCATLPSILKNNAKVRRTIRRGAQIGDFVVLGKSEIIGELHNLSIGREVSLGRCQLDVRDVLSIGANVVINDGARILTATHSLSDPNWSTVTSPVVLCDYCWVATDALILPGVTIGRGAVVAAGAVVRADVPAYAVAIGNPAVISKRQRIKELSYSPVMFRPGVSAWIDRTGAS